MKPATSQFIEQLGVLLEDDGYSPVAGRVLGLLLVSEDGVSLDELAAELGVSKASVSINARLLEQRGVIERISQPGDRRDYYRVTNNVLVRTMEHRIARWKRLHDVIANARKTLKSKNNVVVTRIEELERASAYMLRTTSRALQEWEAQSESKTSRSRTR